MNIATVVNSDSLEALKKMDSELFDLALIDPPYFDYKSGHRQDRSSKLSQGIAQQSHEDQIETVRECIRTLKQDRAFFLFTNWENIWWMQRPLASFLRNMIIWDKGNWTAGDLQGSFGNRYEIIFLGTKGSGWTYTGGRESDIWSIARPGTNRIHPTEKPVELYKKIIENSCAPDSLIIDPYGGSGASAVAAIQTNRSILVYDIDPYYSQAIKDRIAKESQHE